MGLVCCNLAQEFAGIVARVPNQRAVRFDDATFLTYRQLDLLSNRAARLLLSRGVRKGDRIALSLEKTPAPYVLIIAALKVGAAYVALDPRSPAVRRRAILKQCMPSLLFSDRPLQDEEDSTATVLCENRLEEPAFCAGFSPDALDTTDAATASDPAYLMFTSGSTGVPKGAAISHDNLRHFIDWIRAEYGFTPADVHTHLNPLYFDNSVFDIYSTFFTGGTLVPFDFATLQDPPALVTRLRTMQCTVWFSVPSLLMFLQITKVATRANLGTLRKIVFGGEGFPKPRLKQLFEEVGPHVELYNVYGPTECTCICSSYRLSADDFRDLDGYPTLGRLSENFTQHILDGDHPVPPGQVGELCLGGCCVGLGYFNRSDLTSAAFVQNPLNGSFREIIYRTGDLVRMDPADGKLYFVGRRDLQVKHMGYRIELEEIQHAMVDIEGVDEAAVLHRKLGEVSELIAVVASKSGLDPRAIRRELGTRVPGYMVPSTVHVVEHLPKNANGKTDRAALARKFAGQTPP